MNCSMVLTLIVSRIGNFPRWCKCSHFNTVIYMLSSDGDKMQDLSKSMHHLILFFSVSNYYEAISLLGIDHFEAK
jgi:hypothetical protein